MIKQNRERLIKDLASVEVDFTDLGHRGESWEWIGAYMMPTRMDIEFIFFTNGFALSSYKVQSPNLDLEYRPLQESDFYHKRSFIDWLLRRPVKKKMTPLQAFTKMFGYEKEIASLDVSPYNSTLQMRDIDEEMHSRLSTSAQVLDPPKMSDPNIHCIWDGVPSYYEEPPKGSKIFDMNLTPMTTPVEIDILQYILRGDKNRIKGRSYNIDNLPPTLEVLHYTRKDDEGSMAQNRAFARKLFQRHGMVLTQFNRADPYMFNYEPCITMHWRAKK